MHCEDFPGIAIGSENQSLSDEQSNRQCSPRPAPGCLVPEDVPSRRQFLLPTRLRSPSGQQNSAVRSTIPERSSRPVASNRILRNPASASEVPRQIPFDKTPPMPGHCASETCGLMAVSFMVGEGPMPSFTHIDGETLKGCKKAA